jgi:hypothetical protein
MYYWRKTNYKISAAIFTGILLIIFSCDEKKDLQPLYNIDSLVLSQVKLLASNNATLQKTASIGGEKDDSTYVPADTTAWMAELEIFRQLHLINKLINRDQYLIDDGLYDPSSNLTVKAFSAKDKLPVQYIRVFYQETIRKPRKIEALYDDKNALYKSGRLLSMEFEQINNKTMLTSYTVEGGQKMIMGDSVAFLIKGVIIID